MSGPDDERPVSPLLDPARRAYAHRLKQCGATARGVFWRDASYQARRYDILAQAFEPQHRQGGTMIADLGCGYGAFFDYLAPRPVMAGSRYVGYDMTPEMIDACRTRIDDPRATFVLAPRVVTAADYVFASGTFNLKMFADDAAWQGYVLQAIKQAWDKARVGFAFNMLDAAHDPAAQQEGLFYADAAVIEAACRRLAPRLQLRRDPPLPDWTLFLWR